MQCLWVSYRFGERILPHRSFEVFQFQQQNMRLEPTTLIDFATYLCRNAFEILFWAHKHCIATLNVGFYISSAEVAQSGNKLFHRQRILPTDVDATEKRNIDLHLIIASNPESKSSNLSKE